MATGDAQDFLGRLKATLPAGWFPVSGTGETSATPVLDALLTGFATADASLYALLAYVQQQTRIGSATDANLDFIAADFFGLDLTRRNGETDTAYRARIKAALLAPKGTRAALTSALTSLTGRAPVIFEPARPTDAGGYSYCTPVPAAPTLSYVAGGAMGYSLYNAAVSYVFASGAESLLSATTVFETVPVNNLLVASSPAATQTAVGWNLYAAFSDGSPLTRQNAAPIAIGTAWTQPTSGLIAGTLPPAVNRPNSGLAYNSAGGYGSLKLPFQCFVDAFRPLNGGVPNLTPYVAAPGSGGYVYRPSAYGDSTKSGTAKVIAQNFFYASGGNKGAMVPDAEIYATIAATIPAATIAWTRISN